jgi:dethiobiotin synthetase
MKRLIEKLNTYDQFYIIGTSTDVGKTYIGCKLLNELLKLNPDFRPLKPIETGLNGNRWGVDTLNYHSVLKKHNLSVKIEAINKFQLSVPCSPHLSEELENKLFKVNDIIEYCSYKPSFIELAGGLMVPLNETETQLDLIKKYTKPIVLVAHAGLGTLNHVLLTLSQLLFIEHIHIVLNFYDESNFIHRTNFDYLSKRYDTYKVIEVL